MNAPELAQMKLHPVVESFPPMPNEDYQALKTSIQKRGLDEPIVLWKGTIVDGRHRAKAIIELGMTADIKDVSQLSEADMIELVLRANAIRRHLTTGQKALMAHDVAKGIGSLNLQKVSIGTAAKMFAVSEPAVNMLVRALKDEPNLRQAIQDGKVTVHGAKALAEEVASMSAPDRSATINEINTSDRKTIKAKARAASGKKKSKKSSSVGGKMEMPGLTGRYSTLLAVLKNVRDLPDELRSLHKHTAVHPLAPAHATQLKSALTKIRKMDFSDLAAAIDVAVKELDEIVKAGGEQLLSAPELAISEIA